MARCLSRAFQQAERAFDKAATIDGAFALTPVDLFTLGATSVRDDYDWLGPPGPLSCREGLGFKLQMHPKKPPKHQRIRFNCRH
jgi:hypothetical protein